MIRRVLLVKLCYFGTKICSIKRKMKLCSSTLSKNKEYALYFQFVDFFGVKCSNILKEKSFLLLNDQL